MELIKLIYDRLTWENRLCHDVSDIEDVSQCELHPVRRDLDGSLMKCCSPDNRSTCGLSSDGLNPASLVGEGQGCLKGQIWSRHAGKCFTLFGG